LHGRNRYSTTFRQSHTGEECIFGEAPPTPSYKELKNTTVMRKRLCACGCGDRVTLKVEWQHLNAHGPASLASQVLRQNQPLIRRKKRSHFGFLPPFPHDIDQQPTMQNISEIDDDFYMDDPGPSDLANNDTVSSTMMDLDDELYGHHVKQSKYFENISELDNDFI
jgi:hypothetical protein